MKKLLLFVAIISAHSVFSQPIKKVKIDDVVKMIDTSSVPVVVNFWATWCQPCVHEIPWFEKAIAEVKDKPVQLILVSLDFAADFKDKTLQQFVQKQGYKGKVVWLDETNADKFCPQIDSTWEGSIPVTLMVNNKTGYRQFFEFQLKEERFRSELNKLLAD